jgi:plasmid stabilization system protein ParE
MARRFVLTEEAETHLLEILDHVATKSETGAVRVRDAIYEAIERLAQMPGIGHTREDLTDRAVKFWSVYSYLLVYDPASQPLTIIAILHSARDVRRLLDATRRARR